MIVKLEVLFGCLTKQKVRVLSIIYVYYIYLFYFNIFVTPIF